MAYAALLSLSQVLDQILVHDQYLHPQEKENLISVQGNVTTMLSFLQQDYSHSNQISLSETRIIDTAYQLEDVIESKLSTIYLSLYNNKAQSSEAISSEFETWQGLHVAESSQTISSKVETRQGGLHKAYRGVKSVLQKVKNMGGTSSPKKSHSSIKEKNPTNYFSERLQYLTTQFCTYNIQPSSVAIPIQPLLVKIENNGLEESESTNTMVGFDNDYVAIKNRMFQSSLEFQIIPIVGMGGIGKSTLAKRLFEDSIRMQYFDRCVWVVVSQEYSCKDILLGVLQSIKKTKDDLSNNSASKLVELIYKELFGRRYLFVLDDVWSGKAWDEFNTVMPKNNNGSCVLITTRLSKVATYVTSDPVHELRLLSEEQSWSLLKQSVFGTKFISSEIKIIGRKIARECWGLPLTIVVVAGLLKGYKAKQDWENISQNISSREPTIELRCSKVLSLSYDHLPVHLKPCFLYVTAFPEDYVINANRLIRLWMAEGFIKSSGSKCLEEVAEEYLDDLVGRSMLQASKRRYNGRIKTVGIHDLLRDVGTVKAQEERFHYQGHLFTTLGKEHPRRLSIWTESSLLQLGDIRNTTTRSLLIFLSGSHVSLTFSTFTMLRVLYALTSCLDINPQRLVHLRYLAFQYSREDHFISWFKLPNLQTLDINGNYDTLCVPLEIWTMPSLRHLILPEKSYLEQPLEHQVIEETNLVTIHVTSSLEMNRHTTKMLTNLKKLGLLYSGADQPDWKNSQFSNIVHLQKLEELKIITLVKGSVPRISAIAPVELAFPQTLKKLSLDNIQRSWKDMNIIGSLPNLEVLKLRYRVFTDLIWNPIDGQFLKLKYLELRSVRLSHWEADSYHFPSLEILFLQLMMGETNQLKEIPSGLGEIDTLRLIRLSSCKKSIVDSALKIQAYQWDMGNEDLQVNVLNRL